MENNQDNLVPGKSLFFIFTISLILLVVTSFFSTNVNDNITYFLGGYFILSILFAKLEDDIFNLIFTSEEKQYDITKYNLIQDERTKNIKNKIADMFIISLVIWGIMGFISVFSWEMNWSDLFVPFMWILLFVYTALFFAILILKLINKEKILEDVIIFTHVFSKTFVLGIIISIFILGIFEGD